MVSLRGGGLLLLLLVFLFLLLFRRVRLQLLLLLLLLFSYLCSVLPTGLPPRIILLSGMLVATYPAPLSSLSHFLHPEFGRRGRRVRVQLRFFCALALLFGLLAFIPL